MSHPTNYGSFSKELEIQYVIQRTIGIIASEKIDPFVSIDDLRRAIQALRISGRPICLHASLRSFGANIDSGAAGVIRAFLDEGCTLLVPVFTWGFAIPPFDPKPERNGWDYDRFPGPTGGIGRIFTPVTTEIDTEDMGAIATEVVRHPDRVRGNHPLNSFAALGPVAEHLIRGQSPENVYAALEALADADGFILLMGVDLTSVTLLHLAERVAGRNLFRRWANGADGSARTVEVGGCSAGFGAFESVLAPCIQTLTVASSVWRAFPTAETLALATKVITMEPNITHCGNAGCERCRDAILGGPIFAH